MAQGAASQRVGGDNRDYPIRARAGSKQQDRRDSAGEFTVAAVGDRLAAREDEARRIYAASILDQTSVRITIQEPRSPRSVVRSHCRRPVEVTRGGDAPWRAFKCCEGLDPATGSHRPARAS